MTRLLPLISLCLGIPFLLPGCDSSTMAPPGSPDGGTPDGGAPDGSSPDASPPPPITREHAGGEPKAMARVGDLAYVAVGPRLAIWDLSDAAAPALLGESPPFGALLTGVAVHGSHAYVTERFDLDGQLHVVDVSDPASPVTVKSLRVTTEEFSVPLGVAVDGTRLFVADQEQGIVLLDLADPADPQIVRTIGFGGVTGVQIVGTRLYAFSRGFVDTSNQLEAFDLGSADFDSLGTTSFLGANGIAVSPGHIIVAAGIGGLQVRDFADPAQPVDLLEAPEARVLARAVAATSASAWIAGLDGLLEVDLTARPPALGAPVDLPVVGANVATVAGGELMALTDRGRLVTIDLGGTAPALRADVDVSLAADAIGVHADGDRLFVAGGAGGLRCGRLHDLASQGIDFGAGLVDYEDVVVRGDHAYVADWFFGMHVYDVSDPEAPELVGALDTPGSPSSIDLANGHIVLGESTGGGAVRVIDIGTPTAPVERGAITTSFVWDLQAVGSLVYSSDQDTGGPGGLRIWDVSAPAAPELVGEYLGCDSLRGVAVTGTTAVIGCGSVAEIIDVSDPAAPVKVGEYEIAAPNAIWTIAVDGSRAVIGHDAGVTVIDVADPAAPSLVVDKATAYTVRGLDVPAPGRVVAAAGLAGVYQWDIP